MRCPYFFKYLYLIPTKKKKKKNYRKQGEAIIIALQDTDSISTAGRSKTRTDSLILPTVVVTLINQKPTTTNSSSSYNNNNNNNSSSNKKLLRSNSKKKVRKTNIFISILFYLCVLCMCVWWRKEIKE